METKPKTTKRNRTAERGALESEIQREICDYLANKKLFFWRYNNIPVFSMRHDGSVKPRALPKYTPKGLPDIIILRWGKFIALEVKRREGKLRPEQAEFGAKVVLNGGQYHKVSSLIEVKAILAL